MKSISVFFISLFFLPACTVYTITNKTDRSFSINISGGGKKIVERDQCLEMQEYFLGLGGDFPFIISGSKSEYRSGNYEFRVKETKSSPKAEELGKKEADEVVADEVVGGSSISLSQLEEVIVIPEVVSSQKKYQLVSVEKNLDCIDSVEDEEKEEGAPEVGEVSEAKQSAQEQASQEQSAQVVVIDVAKRILCYQFAQPLDPSLLPTCAKGVPVCIQGENKPYCINGTLKTRYPNSVVCPEGFTAECHLIGTGAPI